MGSDEKFRTNLDYYRTFYHVVKSGSISLAASRLSLAQPTITKAVQRLEEDLQCKLLIRTHNGVLLTDEGEVLWKRIEPACDMILEAEKELEMFRALDKGTISIASYETGLQLYVLPAVREFMKNYPEIQVNLLSKQPEEMLSLLRAGLIDAVVVFGPVDLDESFEIRTIGEHKDALIVGKAYAFLAEEEQSFEELARYPFISYTSWQSLRTFLQQCFEKVGMVFEPKLEVGTLPVMLQATIDGLGIGSIAHRLIRQQLEEGSLYELKLKEALPIRQVLVVMNKNGSPSHAAQIFLNDYLPRFADFDTEETTDKSLQN